MKVLKFDEELSRLSLGIKQLEENPWDSVKEHINIKDKILCKVINKDYHICHSCNNTSRISPIVIPYATKLLFQELMSVNILPRIKTDTDIYGDEA